jgi:glyoxylate/hydroxypyruvate reductase A
VVTNLDTVAIRVDPQRRMSWKQELQTLLPELRVVLMEEDAYDPAEVTFAVVWSPPDGWLATLPNLQCVVSVGAGVDHILKDPDYPRHVPILRTVDEALRMRMSEYVVLHVLRFHRRLPEAEVAQRAGEWIQYVEPVAGEVTVGMLGLGSLGSAAARALASLGYRVEGWTRRGRAVDGVFVHCGDRGLTAMLSRSDIVVCMLPHTAATENILNREAFEAMPRGSALINAGRGEQLVEEDLLAALDSGTLRGATLDVFRDEPLPAASRLGSHPRILITAHTASSVDPMLGGRLIADNIAAFRRGDTVAEVVNIDQGY